MGDSHDYDCPHCTGMLESTTDDMCPECQAKKDRLEETRVPKLIGISGKRYAGKSKIAARHLIDMYGFRQVSLATPLKLEVISLGFDADVVCLEKPPHIRELLISLGKAHRAEDIDYFVKKMVHYAAGCLNVGIPVVVDDVRFENEVHAIERLGGVILRLNRHDPLIKPDRFSMDETETALDGFKFPYTCTAKTGEFKVITDYIDTMMRKV